MCVCGTVCSWFGRLCVYVFVWDSLKWFWGTECVFVWDSFECVWGSECVCVFVGSLVWVWGNVCLLCVGEFGVGLVE